MVQKVPVRKDSGGTGKGKAVGQNFYYIFYRDFLFYVCTVSVTIWRESQHISATPPPTYSPQVLHYPPITPPTQGYRPCWTSLVRSLTNSGVFTMASFRSSISAALGTVQTTADTVTKTVSTAAIGVDMLHNWAALEQQKQLASQKYEVKFVEKEAKSKAAMRLADLNMEAAKYMAKDAMHAAAYEAALAELEAS